MKKFFCLLAFCACAGAALSQTPKKVVGAAKPAKVVGAAKPATSTPSTGSAQATSASSGQASSGQAGSGQATSAKVADATNLPSPSGEGLAGEGVDLGKWKGIKPMQMSTDENKKEHDGFLNENGELILEFVSEEF